MKFEDFLDEEPEDEEIEYVDMEENGAEYEEPDEEEDDARNGPGSWLLYGIPLTVFLAALVFFGIRLLSGREEQAGEAPVVAETVEAEPMEMPAGDPVAKEQENGAKEELPQTEETLSGEPEEQAALEEAEDPQEQVQSEEGAAADLSGVQTGAGENQSVSVGIDVARYQGVIDWQQVAGSGVQFAMIRTGYRTQAGGEICEDSTAKYNMQEATKNGIKIGVYFFSTAVNEAEAVQEADWVSDYIAKYRITYPVAYNCEGFYDRESRQFGLDKETRTGIALAFLNRIAERGYTPMFYAAKNEMEGDRDWNVTEISGKYKIWVSQYPAEPFPLTEKSAYSGAHAMWQYTNRGAIPGIPKNVDMNVAYFGYDDAAAALNGETPEEVEANVEALQNFTEVNETVTAKEVVNLRDRPDQSEASVVLRTLANGEFATRTGVSNGGWSRLVIDGQKFYAVSSFLTTDASYVAPEPAQETETQPDNGIKTQFTAVNESVTAKIEVNLRTLPSVTNPGATVAALLKNGEWVTRTGISDNGWSRVEYNGQTLYCISSYLSTAQ